MSALKAIVILAEGFEEIEAITPIDTLKRAGFEVTIAGLGGSKIRGAHGIVVSADIEVKDFGFDADVVILPGGLPGASNLAGDSTVKKIIQQQAANGKWIAAICASPALVLEPAGVLQGKTATCYPGFEKHFDKSVRFSEERVVIDGRVITSRGPGTALEFSLAIVRSLVGEQSASDLSVGMISASGG